MYMLIDDGRVLKGGTDFLAFDNIQDAKEWARNNDYFNVIVVKFEGFV